MMAWLIAKFGKEAIEKWGPVAVLLVIVLVIGSMFCGAYVVGRWQGAAKWKQKTAQAVSERDTFRELADHNYRQYVQADEARERMEAAMRVVEETSAEKEADLRARLKAETARAEADAARAVAEANRRADALAERVRELSVAEACHEAMLELTR